MPNSGWKAPVLFSGGGIAYLLRDTFTTDASAPVTSPRACEGSGTLTFTQNDGSFNISSGRLKMTAQTTAAWGDLAFYGEGVTRELGRTFLTTVRFGATNKNRMLGWSSAASAAYTNYDISIQFWTDGNMYVGQAGNNNIAVGAYAAGVDYQFAFVLGSFNATLLGEGGSDSARGCAIFIKGGAWADWTLLHQDGIGNSSTVYPLYTSLSAADEFDDFRIPSALITSVFPVKNALIHQSTFTAGDGTDLAAYTPETGTAWTERNSTNWEISSNHAALLSPSEAAQPGFVATTPGAADVFVKLVARSILPGAVGDGAHFGPVLRYSNDSNFWLSGLSDHADQWEILRRESGAWITLAGPNDGAQTVTTNAEYTIYALVHGTALHFWTDATGAAVHHLGDKFNYTATIVGMRGYLKSSVNDQEFNTFEAWSLTQNTSALNNY